MMRVGLTGGAGSGKSTVADMLQQLGACVSRSDEVARAMMQAGQAVFRAIEARFGSVILTDAGELDRPALARLAFDEGRLEELNALVHPAVIAEQSRWMAAVSRDEPSGIAIVESALIFETRHGLLGPGDVREEMQTPWRARFDHIIVVTAPESLRRQRYIQRTGGGNSQGQAEAAGKDFDRRARAQWSDGRKAALADTVLQNGGTLDDLHAKVESLYAALKQQSLDRNSEAM